MKVQNTLPGYSVRSWNGIDVQKKAGQTHDYSRRRPVSEWSKRELRRHYPHYYPWFPSSVVICSDSHERGEIPITQFMNKRNMYHLVVSYKMRLELYLSLLISNVSCFYSILYDRIYMYIHHFKMQFYIGYVTFEKYQR